jgi:hypothetical protein
MALSRYGIGDRVQQPQRPPREEDAPDKEDITANLLSATAAQLSFRRRRRRLYPTGRTLILFVAYSL